MSKYLEDFIYRKKVLEFRDQTGEVMGTNKYSETRVSSSGGGGTVSGYIGPHGGSVNGNISAPEITSTVTTKHEFWIRTDDGKEVAIKLTDVDIPLRVGQVITMVSVHKKGGKRGFYCLLVNHNAEKHFFITSGREINGLFKINGYGILHLLVALAVFFGDEMALAVFYGADMMVFLDMTSSFIATGVFLCFAWTMRFFRRRAMGKKIHQHLERIAQAIHQNFAKSSEFTAEDALEAARVALNAAKSSGQGVVTISIESP